MVNLFHEEQTQAIDRLHLVIEIHLTNPPTNDPLLSTVTLLPAALSTPKDKLLKMNSHPMMTVQTKRRKDSIRNSGRIMHS